VVGDIRAVVVGLGIFVVLNLAYFSFLTWVNDVPSFVGALVYVSGYAVPVLAGAVTSFLARGRQFAAVLILGLAAAVCVGAINLFWSWLGLPTDLGDLTNFPVVVGLSLFVQVPLVVVGGALGGFLRNGLHA